jgi:hypothetical protein
VRIEPGREYATPPEVRRSWAERGSRGVGRGCLAALSPSYDEVALFLMSVAFAFLILTNASLQSDARRHVLTVRMWWAIPMLVLFLAGGALSTWHVFTDRPKSEVQRLAMLYFALVVNYAAAVGVALYLWRQAAASRWLLIFPAVNFAHGVGLAVVGGLRMHSGRIEDVDATRPQIVGGLVLLAGLIYLCQYQFELYWAVTFSICVGYATMLGHIVQGFIDFAERLSATR